MGVKIMVPFWVPIITRHLVFRVSKRDSNFDNHPHDRTMCCLGATGGLQLSAVWGLGFSIQILGFRGFPRDVRCSPTSFSS